MYVSAKTDLRFILCDILTHDDMHISNLKKKKKDWRILEVFCSVRQHLLVRKALTAAAAVGVMPQQALAGVYKCMRRHIHTLNGKKNNLRTKA